jgi:hypothetical protein
MRRILLSAAALGGLALGTAFAASAAPAVGLEGLHQATPPAAMIQADYYWHHHHWHHRRWYHHHWRYW